MNGFVKTAWLTAMVFLGAVFLFWALAHYTAEIVQKVGENTAAINDLRPRVSETEETTDKLATKTKKLEKAVKHPPRITIVLPTPGPSMSEPKRWPW